MRRRTPTIETKLAAIDHIKFDQFCRMEGKTKTTVAREAILHYMTAKRQEQLDEHQSALEKRIFKMENRIAGLLVKIGIGISALIHLFWTRTDKEIRKELFAECYARGVERMRSKLSLVEEDLKAAVGE